MEELPDTSTALPPPPPPRRLFVGRPPRMGGLIYSALKKNPAMAFPASASAQDLRYLELEEETREVMEVCSPRCVLEEEGLRCSDSEETSSSSKASTSYAADTQLVVAGENSGSNWRGFFRLWKKKSMRRLSSFPPLGAVPMLSRRRTNRETHVPSSESAIAETPEISFCKPSWKNFTLSELQSATNNFSPESIIGKGGYAEVYKGCLENGQLVAIKRITTGSTDEKTNTFLSELGVIVHLDHPNIARLIGIGVEGGMHLVFQLSPHGSLETVLDASEHKLDWAARYKISLGTAEGLEYLHEKCQRRIIHRDIKAANILLSEDFEPQIGDFGLAKWLPNKLTHHTVSSFEGTFGYLAPEYCMHGIVDEKTDVFAFGVLLLELITGRKALDSSQQSLVMWAKPLLEQSDIKDLIDPSLGDSYDPLQMKYVAQSAYMCIQQSSALRPPMNQVLMLLKGEQERSETLKVLQKSFRRRTYSEEIFDAEEYNATRYLNDLSRHKQLALDF